LTARKFFKEEQLSQQASIASLRRYSFIVWSASLLLVAFGVVSLLLFIRPSLVGVDPSSISGYEGNPIWLVFGVLFIPLGMVFISIAYRWPRHLLHVLRTQQAKPMRLQVEVEESSDNTQYYACLSDDSTGDNPKGWRVGLWASPRDTRGLVGHELRAMVFFDPRTEIPVVIEHANGYLWAMKGAVIPYSASTIPIA
jgi:hypothetical protein